jgi:NAD(P)-dependent dehydrogenase (short-subunit alcohol dehydrogenase family)
MIDINTKLGEKVQKDLGPDTLFHPADVSIYHQQAVAFKKAFDWHKRLDFFAANAGIADTQNMYDANEEEDENGLVKPLEVKTMQVDLDSVLQGIWIFKHYARKNPVRGGKIVITSSMAGL